MSLATASRITAPFTGDGAEHDYPFTFKTLDEDDVLVVGRDEDGEEYVMELTADYSVTLNADQDTSPGGYITATVTDDDIFVITTATTALQSVHLLNNGGFYPAVINAALDRLTILVQQIKVDADRALKFPLTDDPELDNELPTDVLRAGGAVYFDEDGNVLISPNLGTSLAAIAQAVIDAEAAATAAEAAADLITTFTDLAVDGNLAANVSYLATAGALVTGTLPAAAAKGSFIKLSGYGAGGWKIAQGVGQQIIFGNLSSTAGAGGYLASTHRYDCVTLRCVVANTTWLVEAAVGNIDVS